MPRQFQVPEIWKTLRCGKDGPRNSNDLREVMDSLKIKIDERADLMLDKIKPSALIREREIRLVKLNNIQLGLGKIARRDIIYKQIKRFGLELCPPEVGPLLRIQYTDQPNGEWLLIGMNSICCSPRDPRIFDVGRGDSGLWLISYDGAGGRTWGTSYQWIFVRPHD
jgi:hypothetical protein